MKSIKERIKRIKQNRGYIFLRNLLLKFLNEETLRIGSQGLLTHKLRSLLTMLGIIFGVAAVISMLAIGEGARRKSLAQIQALGLNNIIIKNQQTFDEQEDEQVQSLELEDVSALQHIVKQLSAVVAIVQREYTVSYKTRQEEYKITGSGSEYFKLFHLQIDKGGFFAPHDNQYYQRVCVLGSSAARELFIVENPLGKMIKIGPVWFRVIGVLSYHPVSTAGSEEVNLNNHIFVPLNSALVRLPSQKPPDSVDEILVRVDNEEKIPAVARVIDNILYRRHHQQKIHHLIVPEQLLRQSAETQRIFNIVMGAIAGISLLVGGIGIMNIMLASVLERTREIGIRRSVGATRQDVRNQFLIEAVFLSLAGGLIGVLLGYVLAYGVTLFSEWETAVSLWSVLLAFGVSSGVGVIFGYYPARKAAELNPIEALRYE